MSLSKRRWLERSSIAVLGIVVVATSAAAQTPAPTPARTSAASPRAVSFGVIGGLTRTSMTLPLELLPAELEDPTITASAGSATGGAGGFFVAFPAQGRVTLETGALLTVKGSSMDVTVPGVGTANGRIRATYLDLPFLARIEAMRWSNGRFYILTGPTVDVKVDAAISFSFQGQSESMAIDGFPRMDYGWAAGGRVAMRRWLFEVRYDHGLRNLADDGTGATVKNRAVTALAGWQF